VRLDAEKDKAMNLVGMLIGAIVGEYMFQPEVLAATKRSSEAEAVLAGALHAVLWAMIVLACGVSAGFAGGVLDAWDVPTLIVLLLALAGGHYVVCCSVMRSVLVVLLRVPSLNRSLEFIRQVEIETEKPMEPGLKAVSLTYGIVGDKLFDLATHSLLVFMAWVVLKLVGA
jgi:hypothetical protein